MGGVGLGQLLGAPPQVVNVGLRSFADELKGLGVPVVHVRWRPPVAAPDAVFLAALLEDDDEPGSPGWRIRDANLRAVKKIVDAEPVLVDIRPAREAIPGVTPTTILHAGPPVTWERMCGPMRGAVVGALLYEGLAETVERAIELAGSGEIEFAPCHSRGAVGPMAGIISSSMPVMVVENRENGNRAYATMNEGWGRTLRFGAFDEDVIARLKWMERVLAPVLREAVLRLGGINIKTVTAQALHMGDECHNRDIAATCLLFKRLAPVIASLDLDGTTLREVFAFLGEHEHFFLNVSMAACKASLDAAHGIPASSIVTAIARNGVEVGIRVSGLGDGWFTAPAPVPDGLYFAGFSEADANPDIGDSAISEALGIGAFIMGNAPAIVNFVGGTAEEALRITREMYQITVGKNPSFPLPVLSFQGAPVGIDVRKVVHKGILPVINTGIAHKEPGHGLVGAGVTRVPAECFEKALRALAGVLGVCVGEVKEEPCSWAQT
jgi:hypothetical protein